MALIQQRFQIPLIIEVIVVGSRNKALDRRPGPVRAFIWSEVLPYRQAAAQISRRQETDRSQVIKGFVARAQHQSATVQCIFGKFWLRDGLVEKMFKTTC